MPPSTIARVVLTGFMGSGKSTVGPLLAARLHWRFLDLDTEIERRENISIAAIFATHGEEHFRGLEAATLTRLLTETNLVLGLGGGAIETPANRSALTTSPGTAIVYLQAPLATLLDRCRLQDTQAGAPTRPLLDQAAARLAARLPLYEQLAHATVPTGHLPPAQVAEHIVAALPLHPHPLS